MQLIAAVPNISEAKERANLARLIGDLQATLGGARLLHVDSNIDANRTVLTLIGNPQQVTWACFMLFRASKNYIDMRFHKGSHPRLGAVDVCPLIPVTGITLEQTALLANSLAQRVATELNIPVYLYEASARRKECKNLASIRQGEYENLPEKMRTLPPDYGPCLFSPSVATTGASIIGARNVLIAFNISLNTTDVSLAKQIAQKLREKNGGLPSVKAIGWYMENYKCAQVSFNLTNFHQSNLQDVFEACKREAQSLGLQITGSELIGLIPREAIVRAGKFYAPTVNDEEILISTAVDHLLLNNIHPFVAKERILENALSL